MHAHTVHTNDAGTSAWYTCTCGKEGLDYGIRTDRPADVALAELVASVNHDGATHSKGMNTRAANKAKKAALAAS
jgi:hypothetical protein